MLPVGAVPRYLGAHLYMYIPTSLSACVLCHVWCLWCMLNLDAAQMHVYGLRSPEYACMMYLCDAHASSCTPVPGTVDAYQVGWSPRPSSPFSPPFSSLAPFNREAGRLAFSWVPVTKVLFPLLLLIPLLLFSYSHPAQSGIHSIFLRSFLEASTSRLRHAQHMSFTKLCRGPSP